MIKFKVNILLEYSKITKEHLVYIPRIFPITLLSLSYLEEN